MPLLFLLFGAIALIILGARGTYKAVWNQYFPNEPIVTTPINTQANATTPTGQQGGYVIPAQPGTTANPSSTKPVVTPNVPVTGSGSNIATNKTGQTSSGQHVTVITGGGVYPNQTVGRSKSTVITTGIPSWWPSWLPYPSWFPHPGQGQTGQTINTPGIMGGG